MDAQKGGVHRTRNKKELHIENLHWLTLVNKNKEIEFFFSNNYDKIDN